MLPARLNRMKAAQNQIIALCGGIDAAVSVFADESGVSTIGRSTVGRWNDLGDPTLMPMTAVLRLEAACGQPIITAALAELSGRRLSDPDAQTVNQSGVLARHAEAIIQAGELMSAGAAAFADGRVTPNEAVSIDRAAAQLERGLSAYRQALAGIRAQGGLQVVEGGK